MAVTVPGPLPHRRRLPRAAVALSCAVLALAPAACLGPDARTRGPYTTVSSPVEPHPVPMPGARSPELPGGGETTRTAAPAAGSCAVDDVTVAACLPEITAVTGIDAATAVAATADGTLWLVRHGAAPRVLAELGGRVRQLTAHPRSSENGQVYVLLDDGSFLRVTSLPGTAPRADVRALEAPGGTGAFRFSSGGRPQFLTSSSDDVLIVSVCDGAAQTDLPVLVTAIYGGVPVLAQETGGVLAPITTVDTNDSIGGCAFDGRSAAVAVPAAQKVVAYDLVAPGQPWDAWTAEGTRNVLVDGEFGHVSTVAVVPGAQGPEFWGGTANRSLSADGPAESDDRVVRLPNSGAAGGSPD